VVMPEECQSIPITAPKGMSGALKRDLTPLGGYTSASTGVMSDKVHCHSARSPSTVAAQSRRANWNPVPI
jgi:hypothetical protein